MLRRVISARPGPSFHRDRDREKAKFAGTGTWKKCNIPGPGIPNSRSRYIGINMTGTYREKERPGQSWPGLTGIKRDRDWHPVVLCVLNVIKMSYSMKFLRYLTEYVLWTSYKRPISWNSHDIWHKFQHFIRTGTKRDLPGNSRLSKPGVPGASRFFVPGLNEISR